MTYLSGYWLTDWKDVLDLRPELLLWNENTSLVGLFCVLVVSFHAFFSRIKQHFGFFFFCCPSKFSITHVSTLSGISLLQYFINCSGAKVWYSFDLCIGNLALKRLKIIFFIESKFHGNSVAGKDRSYLLISSWCIFNNNAGLNNG